MSPMRVRVSNALSAGQPPIGRQQGPRTVSWRVPVSNWYCKLARRLLNALYGRRCVVVHGQNKWRVAARVWSKRNVRENARECEARQEKLGLVNTICWFLYRGFKIIGKFESVWPVRERKHTWQTDILTDRYSESEREQRGELNIGKASGQHLLYLGGKGGRSSRSLTEDLKLSLFKSLETLM